MEQYIMYLRKSAMDNDFESSTVEETLRRHKTILTDYAKSKRLNVTVVLEEVVSGESLASRPQMMKCLELANTGEYSGVLCMDIDRLSRGNSMDSGYITQVLQINNCKIITPAKTYDLANESDEQFTDMKFMFSRYELKTITKRMHRGRDASALEGKYIGSVPPFGYERYKLKGTKGYSLKINPEQAEIVRLVFDLYTNKDMGYDRVINEVKKLGIQPTYPISVWDRHTVQNIIKNPVYIGKIRYKHKPQQKVMIDGKIVKKRTLNKDGDIIVDGLHEPIISEELWNKAQVAQKRKPSVRVDRELQNPFAKVVICGKCGRVMTRKLCYNGRYRIDCPAIGCDTRSMYFTEFEEIVVAEMKKWFDKYKITISQESIPEDNTLQQALDSINSQLANLEDQQNKICELLEKGVYSIEVFTKRNEKLQSDISALRDSKRKLEEELNKPKSTVDIVPSVQGLLDSYDIMNPKQKNALWQEVMDRIEYFAEPNEDKLHLEFYPKL